MELREIGTVRCGIKGREDAPKNFHESDHEGILDIDGRYREAMEDIEAGETIVVLFWLHQADRDVLKVYPRGDRSRGLRGVFSTRSPVRPNPIAISELKVLAVDGCRLSVRGLDVLDGTPVIDIKKKLFLQSADRRPEQEEADRGCDQETANQPAGQKHQV